MPARYAEASNKVFHSRDTAARYFSRESDNYQRTFQSAEQTTSDNDNKQETTNKQQIK
jgi:hypothetical protein